MAYNPSNRRANLIRGMCSRWIQANMPQLYLQFTREAEHKVPRGKSGRDVVAMRKVGKSNLRA